MQSVLYHFSDNPAIATFVPRQTKRQKAPCVWAISAPFAFLYLFPRDCPRIAMWATDQATDRDSAKWRRLAKRVASIEDRWLDQMHYASMYRYHFPACTFTPLHDVGMHISHATVTPTTCGIITDLPQALTTYRTELRHVPNLQPLQAAHHSSLHVSSVRMRLADNP